MAGSFVDRIRARLRGDSGPDDATGAVLLPAQPVAYEDARDLARHADPMVRQALASHHETPEEVLYFMAGDQDPSVRRCIAQNPRTPSRADYQLSTDADPLVRSDLAAKISRLAPGLTDSEQDKVRRFVYLTLQQLARDQAATVRRLIAETLKSEPTAPTEIIRTLARDVDLEVSTPILQFSPVLSDDDLLAIIEQTSSSSALSAISKRAQVSASVSDAIVLTNCADAITDLLANASAQIREETLDRLIEQSPQFPSWQESLVRRPVLSNQSALRLASVVTHHLLEQLQARSDMSDALRSSLAETVRRRLRSERASSPASKLAPGDLRGTAAHEMVVSMDQAGTLSETVVLNALGVGDREFVMTALAVRAGLALAVVRRIVDSRNAPGMVALSWHAGLSVAAAVHLQSRLARISTGDLILPAKGSQSYPQPPEEMAATIGRFQALAD